MKRTPGAVYTSVRSHAVEIASVPMKIRQSCVMSICDFWGLCPSKCTFHFWFYLFVYKPIVIMKKYTFELHRFWEKCRHFEKKLSVWGNFNLVYLQIILKYGNTRNMEKNTHIVFETLVMVLTWSLSVSSTWKTLDDI